MGTFQTFERDLKVATADLSEEAISSELARFAKQELARAIENGEGSQIYTRYVGGVAGAREETVKAPGPILYVFSWWRPIVEMALAELVKRSPHKSGRFASSFIVIAGDRIVTDYDTLQASDEVIVVNAQPYSRKVQVGAMQMSVPAHMFDAARSAVKKAYGGPGSGFDFAVRFVDIAPGVHPLIPYRLKGEYAGRFNAQRSRLKSGQPLRAGEARLQRRKDREPGQPITYPALILNMVLH
jgi:hypothetical protein